MNVGKTHLDIKLKLPNFSAAISVSEKTKSEIPKIEIILKGTLKFNVKVAEKVAAEIKTYEITATLSNKVFIF